MLQTRNLDCVQPVPEKQREMMDFYMESPIWGNRVFTVVKTRIHQDLKLFVKYRNFNFHCPFRLKQIVILKSSGKYCWAHPGIRSDEEVSHPIIALSKSLILSLKAHRTVVVREPIHRDPMQQFCLPDFYGAAHRGDEKHIYEY